MLPSQLVTITAGYKVSPAVAWIQSVKSSTLVMTPGWRGSPHPIPQLTTPAR